MQKIQIINLGGNILQIEESAYAILLNYLISIKKHFQNQHNGNEIIQDLEQRLAKILLEKSALNQSVVDQKNVLQCIELIPMPTKISENDEPKFVSTFDNDFDVKKKFFRNTDRRIIGGVCTGLAAYIGIEYWIIRALFVASLFFAGFGFWIYIILWIVVPKAITKADRLAMQGKPFSLESTIDYLKKKSEELNEGKLESFLKPILDIFIGIGQAFVRLFRKISGIILLLISGFLLLILFLAFNFQSTSWLSFNGQNFDFQSIIKIVYANSSNIKILLYSILVFLFIPILYILLFSYWLIYNRIATNRFLHFGLISAWIIAILTSLYFLFDIRKEFLYENKNAQSMVLSKSFNAVLKIVPFISDSSIGHHRFDFNFNKYGVIIADSGLYFNNIQLEIDKSNSDQIELIYESKSNGKTMDIALENAKNINYKFSMLNNNLLLDDFFKLKLNNLWRNQKVKLTLKIPENQEFEFDSFIDRFDLVFNNLSNEIDEESIAGKIFKWQENKIVCTNCD